MYIGLPCKWVIVVSAYKLARELYCFRAVLDDVKYFAVIEI